MLHADGYKAKDLAKEIDLLLNETDPKKALPHHLRSKGQESRSKHEIGRRG
jgi:hypothetical protein